MNDTPEKFIKDFYDKYNNFHKIYKTKSYGTLCRFCGSTSNESHEKDCLFIRAENLLLNRRYNENN